MLKIYDVLHVELGLNTHKHRFLTMLWLVNWWLWSGVVHLAFRVTSIKLPIRAAWQSELSALPRCKKTWMANFWLDHVGFISEQFFHHMLVEFTLAVIQTSHSVVCCEPNVLYILLFHPYSAPAYLSCMWQPQKPEDQSERWCEEVLFHVYCVLSLGMIASLVCAMHILWITHIYGCVRRLFCVHTVCTCWHRQSVCLSFLLCMYGICS